MRIAISWTRGVLPARESFAGLYSPAGRLLSSCLASTLPVCNHRRVLERTIALCRGCCHVVLGLASCPPALLPSRRRYQGRGVAIIAAHAIGGRWPPGPLLINVIADTEIHIAVFHRLPCPCAAPVPHTGARATVGIGTAQLVPRRCQGRAQEPLVISCTRTTGSVQADELWGWSKEHL